MVPGIPPREASDRLGIFQARFDELWRKYETYSGKDIFLVIYFLVLLDISLNVEVPITYKFLLCQLKDFIITKASKKLCVFQIKMTGSFMTS